MFCTVDWHIKVFNNVTCFVPFLNQVYQFLLVVQTVLLQLLSLPIFSLYLWSIRLFKQPATTSCTS